MAAGLTASAVTFIAGAILAFKVTVHFTVFFAVIFIIVCIILSLTLKNSFWDKIIFICIFSVSVILTQNFADIKKKELYEYENIYVSVSGRISELPQKDGDNTRYVLDAVSVVVNGNEKEIKERLLVTSKDSYSYNESVTFQGFIKEIPDKMSEYGFDLKRHYMSKDIFFKLYAYKSEVYEKSIRSFSIYSLSNSLKNSISQIIDKYAPNDQGAILKAILTGDKNKFSEDFDEVLTRTGTKRFFYPSFLHISIIVYLIGIFSSILGKKVRDILTVFLLMIYVIAQSSHPILIKGGLLTIAVILFKRKHGFVYLPDAVGAVVLVVGFLNPLMLYDAGFILGTTASVIINFFYEPVLKLFGRVKNITVRKIITIGSICTLGLMPINAYYFSGITPYTTITSFLFLPVTMMILVLSPCLLIMLELFGTAPIIGEAVTAFVWIYMKAPYFINAIPLSYIGMPKPSALFVATFYVCLYGVWLRYRNKRELSGYAFMISAVFAMVMLSGQAARINKMEITFVNVEQGDGAVIDMPYRNAVLIDGGGGTELSEDYNPGESMFLPYLQRKGISRIDCAIVSHSHKDHIEGIIAAMENLRVEHLYLPKPIDEIKYFNELVITAKETGTKVHIVEKDVVLNFNSGLRIDIKVPIKSIATTDENDTSLLVRASFGNSACTFTGDMSKISEKRYIDAGKVEPSEILKVAHHGSDTSNSGEFIEKVSPSLAVISVGKNNNYGLPSRKVLDRLSNIRVIRTDIHGDIMITSDMRGIRKIETFK